MLTGRTFIATAGFLAFCASAYHLIMRGQSKPKHCVFCHPLELSRIVYQDPDLLVFHDIKPDAALHLLVIPREHLGTIKELSPDHLPVIRRMHMLGQRLMEEKGFTGDNARFGFHRPPFNSVHHLHMHCLGLPFKPKRAERMFPKDGSAWFMPAERLIENMAAESLV